MAWNVTAKCRYVHPAFGEDVIQEEYEADTLQELVAFIQDKFHWHGEGLWVIIPSPNNPPCERSVYAALLETPHPDWESRYRVKVLPDRLVVRVILP